MGGPVSVYVPCWFVADKAINFPLEVLASSGTPLVLRGKEGKPLRVRPATLGFFVLLEWIDSPFFRNPAGADLLDVCRAVACANGGRDLFPVDRARLDREAEKIAAESGAALAENFGMLCDWLLAVPWYGYEMLRNHSGGRKPERFLFAGPVDRGGDRSRREKCEPHAGSVAVGAAAGAGRAPRRGERLREARPGPPEGPGRLSPQSRGGDRTREARRTAPVAGDVPGALSALVESG